MSVLVENEYVMIASGASLFVFVECTCNTLQCNDVVNIEFVNMSAKSIHTSTSERTLLNADCKLFQFFHRQQPSAKSTSILDLVLEPHIFKCGMKVVQFLIF